MQSHSLPNNNPSAPASAAASNASINKKPLIKLDKESEWEIQAKKKIVNQVLAEIDNQKKESDYSQAIEQVFSSIKDYPASGGSFYIDQKYISSATKLDKYINRLIHYLEIDLGVLLYAFLFLQRYFTYQGLNTPPGVQPNFLNEFNAHRMILVAMLIAQKNTDDFFKNKAFAMIGGVSLQELNQLETYFLFGIDFDLWIDAETLRHYLHCLRTENPCPDEINFFASLDDALNPNQKKEINNSLSQEIPIASASMAAAAQSSSVATTDHQASVYAAPRSPVFWQNSTATSAATNQVEVDIQNENDDDYTTAVKKQKI